jgi:hypothetical protein
VLAADANCLDAYLLRANGLHRLGMTPKALDHLAAAMQRDPDNTAVARRLKELRRISRDATRVRTELQVCRALVAPRDSRSTKDTGR